MDREKQDYQSTNQSNDGYTNAGVIQLRLDTGPLLDQLEAFFRGRRIIGYKEEHGAVIPVYGDVGKAKMNSIGVQSLMSWLTPLFSAHTVQGNFQTVEDLYEFLIRLEIDIASYVYMNRYDWDISILDQDGIIDMIVNTANAFYTRLLFNKERESYAATIKSIESSRSERDGGGLLGIFK